LKKGFFVRYADDEGVRGKAVNFAKKRGRLREGKEGSYRKGKYVSGVSCQKKSAVGGFTGD